MTKAVWQEFSCSNPACDWTCPGTYSNEPEMAGCLPDTDCPKCGFHDSVTDGKDIEQPQDLDDVRSRVRGTGLLYAW